MEIKWLGQSCFRLKGKTTTVITDPYPPDFGRSLGKQTADIVTVSHQHAGHSYVKGIEGNPHAVTGPGEYEIGDVIIIGIATFHDAEGGKLRGKNTVYLIEMEELSICHLGDLGHLLTDAEAEELGKVDILLVPVGAGTTINAATAAQLVRKLEPKIVIPMHYKTAETAGEMETANSFLKEIGVSAATPQAKLVVTRANLPETMAVVVLEH